MTHGNWIQLKALYFLHLLITVALFSFPTLVNKGCATCDVLLPCMLYCRHMNGTNGEKNRSGVSYWKHFDGKRQNRTISGLNWTSLSISRNSSSLKHELAIWNFTSFPRCPCFWNQDTLMFNWDKWDGMVHKSIGFLSHAHLGMTSVNTMKGWQVSL